MGVARRKDGAPYPRRCRRCQAKWCGIFSTFGGSGRLSEGARL